MTFKRVAGLSRKACDLIPAFWALWLFAGTPVMGAEHFDDANIRATIRILSSDDYGGRAPASTGERLSIEYIANQFKRYGLLPANHDSYLQDVPLVQITADPGAVLEIKGQGKGQRKGERTPLDFAYGREFVAFTPRPQATVSLVDSPLVFAGYGIVAPEYGWNDYAGLDVKGKTVIVLVNDPGYATQGADAPLFRGKTMTYYGRWTYKYEEAARQGAAGLLIVHETGPAGYSWENVRHTWMGPQEQLSPGDAYRPLIQGWLSHEAANKLLADAGMKFAELALAAARPGFKPVALNLTASLTLHNQVSAITSHNVVGVIKGSRTPQQVLIYSAHWDHLGTKPGENGKPQIFHGAVDNASGVAGLLELARVYAHDKPTSRSILFIATTAEEQNLSGATYYASHPLFPLAQTVADLNMDMMNVYGRTRDMAVFGSFMSTLDDALQQTTRELGLRLLPGAEPEKGYYFRADHFAFARVGVPALTIGCGTDYVGRAAGWGLGQQQAYTAQRYHTQADAYDASWDLGGMRQQLKLLYLTGRKLADSNTWPVWYPGTPFPTAHPSISH